MLDIERIESVDVGKVAAASLRVKLARANAYLTSRRS